MPSPGVLIWLVPSILTLLLYGVAQGLVKKYSGDVPPARFCLFFIVARSLVFLGWFFTHPSNVPPFSPEGRAVLWAGVGVYLLDGIGWILYYKSIVLGPISIVGTLSAAYPAPTVIFARVFLGEALTPLQYVAVTMIIAGCAGLSYEPSSGPSTSKNRSWIPLAATALILWGAAQTLLKYAYRMPYPSDAGRDVNMTLFATFGGAMTLGVYGLLYGRKPANATGSTLREWTHSFLPMAVMAGGDLGVIIATAAGPVSIVTPLTGAYPIVTVPFAAYLLRERVTKQQIAFMALVLVGMWLCQGS